MSKFISKSTTLLMGRVTANVFGGVSIYAQPQPQNLRKDPYVKNKVGKTIMFSQLIYVFRWHIQGRFVYNVKYG